MEKIIKEIERRSNFAKQQWKRYAEQRGRIQWKKNKLKLQVEANDGFK